jgi:preprotein translocase subunit SecE
VTSQQDPALERSEIKAATARQASWNFVNITKIIIAVVIVGAIFGLLWWKGYLVRVANYVQETREELRKCSWPSWEELKGSTVLIFVSLLLLSAFTVAVDRLFATVLHWIT